MSVLRVHLFGGVRVERDSLDGDLRLTRRVQALLAYLLLQPRPHPREVLADLLWGEQDASRARSCLSTTLWRLRRALADGGYAENLLVTTPAGEVGIDRERGVWLDVATFEAEARRVMVQPPRAVAAADVSALENAIHLYTGDLLEGFYDDWALRERERVRSLYLSSLHYLLRYYQYRGDYARALTCGASILDLDPLREDIHRAVIRLHLAAGQRTLGLRQYDTCRRLLEEELGIDPMPETQQLLPLLVQTDPPDHPGPPANSARQVVALQGEVRLLTEIMAELQQRLQRLVDEVERLSPPDTPHRPYAPGPDPSLPPHNA